MDSADNIKGCKGIGEKRANILLKGFNNYRNIVLDKYCEIYGEIEGIKNFYINYTCLHIVDDLVIKDYKINKSETIPSE